MTTLPPPLNRLFRRPLERSEELLAGPLRGDLLGPEHLAERARALAAAQRVAPVPVGGRRPRLLDRLRQTRAILSQVHARLAVAADRELNVGPAGEWLLDNFHIVEEHIREVRDSLPSGYYRELPELAGGPLLGFPRVYEVGTTLISHTEARVELDTLTLFVGAFQEVVPLRIGELWAIPAMLRLALLESVRRLAIRTARRMEALDSADAWAARMIAAGEQGPGQSAAVLGEFVSNPPGLTPVFIARFVHRLRSERSSVPSLLWLEQWIGEQAITVDEASARATEQAALTQVMMANTITSLRTVAHLRWDEFVEAQSVVEAILREDPAGAHARQTFATRDQYRHVVERIAKRTGREEPAVARSAVELARAAGDGADPRSRHVGYYLADRGVALLEQLHGYRPTFRQWLHRSALRHPNFGFVGGIIAGTVIAVFAALWLAGPEAQAAWPLVVLFALIPANDIAVNVMNQLVTAFLPPRLLPKLDFSGHEGVPPEFRTAVVVPTLFDRLDAVSEMLEQIEVQYLANREAHLHFAILSDFTDAPSESLPSDAAIVRAAADGIRALNAKYAPETQDAFYLFHRPRRWNPRQGVWMGWERKRGKLADFNRFVRGAAEDAFSTVVGNREVIRQVRFVITLDSDTVLPPEAAALLVGAQAHPLNRPVFDRSLGRVMHGYGIVQPRVSITLTSAHRSTFAAVQSGEPGVDPYTTAVSDVYQDLYAEGSFTGKGIYDVDAFEQATHGRFPENTLLSHDLIEGNYARAGLATDIVLYDDYPARYLTYTRRKHRWIRGDWQLLRWLGDRVPGPDGPEPNRLSVLSRWKILDNLRRSTVEIAQLLFVAAGWTILPGTPLRWTLLTLGAIATPWLVALLLALLRLPRGKSWRAYYRAVGHDAGVALQQATLAIAFLPHQAWISADAIGRTLWRLFVSRRNLLEWQTASQVERSASRGARAAWRTMWPAVAVVAVLALGSCILAAAEPGRLNLLIAAAVPLVALWTASPALAYAISAPAVRRERRLPPARRAEALRYALLHWRFFERFVGEETGWLAPDNYQEEPAPVVAMRTSPTNIGLQLLATVSAHDLGFIPIDEMVERLERIFQSLERMQRYRGHFYNWYDLPTLRVLEPAYISTVDSGNLAGHLIALRHACLAIPDQPELGPAQWHTLETGIALARERLRAAAAEHAEAAAPLAAVEAAAEKLEAAGRHEYATLVDLLEPIKVRLEQAGAALEQDTIPRPVRAAGSEWIDWTLRLVRRNGAEGHGPVLRPAGGRGGEQSPSTESLRERAARSPAAAELVSRLEVLADRAYRYALEMDFRFLYDENRSLFAIGYQPGAPTLDGSHYDLLASEARLASYVAAAKGDVPIEHWFRLSRTVTRVGGETALVSWSGSMFEYLMPALVMRLIPFTVLDQTARAAVRRHIAHGAKHGVPWGVSESAFNLRDSHGIYQYRAFGVPDLALKRGLGRDLVVAPYATALATMVATQPSLNNLKALERLGGLGPYGFHDALDYTRPEAGQRYAVVHNYMAHHIGMSLVALTNALMADVWPRRFHADPLMRSAELLLQERVPRRYELQAPQTARAEEALPEAEVERPAVREVDTPDTPQPHVALLGHLPYTIMVSHCGSGYSRYEGLAVTRWRADGTRDHTGQFCYLRDRTTGRVWSAAHQPVCAPADEFRSLLATDRVTFHRVDGDIETRTEVVTVPADAAEVRRVTVTNLGTTTHEVELTSYGEIVLAPPDADRAHPAFGSLFVETEWHDWCTAITATRRPRSAEERPVWCAHVVDTGPRQVGAVTCETDRARFVGRGRTTRNPAALDQAGDLSNTTGAVLDPIFAIRTRVRIEPRESASVAFTTLVATSREAAFELADRYHHGYAARRALDLAWTSAQVELRELNVTPADAAIYQEIAGHLFYSNPALRAPEGELVANRGSQPLLWAIGVSGEWPILLANVDALDGLPTLRQLLVAHHYWRRRGMMVDLVVLNTHPPSYRQDLDHAINTAIHTSPEAAVIDQPGGVFARRRDLLAPDVLTMLRATARVHVACDGRSLQQVVERAAQQEAAELLPAEPAPARSSGLSSPPGILTLLRVRTLATARRLLHTAATALEGAEPDQHRRSSGPAPRGGSSVEQGNRFGRLTADGDYEIRIGGEVPPAPWVNVIANRRAGFVVSERGTGATWGESSYFYRLTPWHNDPVSDPPSDVVYLRDTENGEVWSATPAPVPGEGEYVVTHAAGSSSFTHRHGGIETRLVMGVPDEDPVKLSLLRVTNTSDRNRTLTVTTFVEWVLGVLREHTQHQVRTAFDAEYQAILARNSFDPSFAARVAFHATSEQVSEYTADRREFVGRNGTPEYPAGIDTDLSGETGAILDPCAVLRSNLELAPGQSRELVVLLGSAETEAAARRLLAEYRDLGRARKALAQAAERWSERLSTIRVRTPEPTFDAMLNRWTLYQALACRMWGRSAVYQSSGAYGFRDQLQDVMAFVYAEPLVAREHIVRAAGRQFVEGDVQHWWHPQTGRGVRTRFSDDLAWLPYVVEHYVRVTGDASVLDEPVAFLSMRPLQPHEHEVYDTPSVSDQLAPVYEHCLRALRKACTAGAHGLPLIGTGDWNDGMSRVGVDGRGESVWLAWFLIATLRRFAPLCERRGDRDRAEELRRKADEYVLAVEAHGWDGEWYRRAFFDDGTPLGSAANDECRIDSIAQSWSVISGAGAPERAARAMRSLEQHLVRSDAGLLLLLAPPFDRTPRDPGYIKGYLPGVRENGAQYTHAALWTVLATALRGDAERAFELFQMINPLTRTDTPEGVERYQVEPYVVAADVYSAKGQVGRGGWTWYTGSASWMYRVGLETILGFTREGDSLSIHPRVPSNWPEYSIEYRYGTSVYVVRVLDPARAQPGAQAITLDDRVLEGERIPLMDDGQKHSVTVQPIPH